MRQLFCPPNKLFCFFSQVSANGSVLRSEIVGSIKLKVVLSGMPELRLGLNDKVLFEITGSKYQRKQSLKTITNDLSCIHVIL